VETRYEIRKFGSRRRDSLNGAQARGAQVFGCTPRFWTHAEILETISGDDGYCKRA
jgi:hypothetical protein